MARPALAALWLCAAVCVVAAPSGRAAGQLRAYGYIRELPPESDAARAERHRRVRERREHTGIIVHRGATAFAPENTLEAYAAAMDYGADGCEMDLRRTRDGVLVLFHDDMLDQLTDRLGTVNRLHYVELLQARPTLRYGTATRTTRPPTFAAVLALARQRAMLLHLHIKEGNIDADIARMLDAADAWDHVIGVGMEEGSTLGKDKRLNLLRYKGPGLFATRLDVDPEAVKAQLARPGQLIMVDDPRVAAHELGRPPYLPVAQPTGLRQEWAADPARLAAARDPRDPMDWLASDPPQPGQLASGPLTDRQNPDGSQEYERDRTHGILRRARAALSAAEEGEKTPQLVEALLSQLNHRALHRDWMYHGLDGAMAVRALGMLHAVEAVPALVATFKRVDPELKKVVNPEWKDNPLAWTDFRTKMYIIPTLGQLRCPESKRFLLEYLSLEDAVARQLAPLLFPEATKALLRQDVTQAEVEALLRSNHPEVRGVAVLDCLDHPSRTRTAALKAAAPWVLDLPRAHKA